MDRMQEHVEPAALRAVDMARAEPDFPCVGPIFTLRAVRAELKAAGVRATRPMLDSLCIRVRARAEELYSRIS